MGVVEFTRQPDRVDQEAGASWDEVPIKIQVLSELVRWNNGDSRAPAENLFDHGGHIGHFRQIRHPRKPERFTIRTHSIDLLACPGLGFRARDHGHDEHVDRHAGVVAAGGHDRRSQVHGLFIISSVPHIWMKENVADERGRRCAATHGGFDGIPPFLEDTAVERAHLSPGAPPEL